MSQAKATDLKEVSRLTSPAPLKPETWDFYVDTDRARGNRPAIALMSDLLIARDNPEPIRAILTGHTGCGKSTELVRISRELKDDYEVVLCQVDDRYSLPALDYRQLLFLCAQLLIEQADKLKARLDDQTSQAIIDWFDEHEVQETKKEGYEIGAEAGGKVGLLVLLFTRFWGKIFSGGERQQKAIRHIEQRLDQLRTNMQLVVRAIEAAIAPRRLLLVLEGLDKLEDIDRARALFVDQRLQLLSIPCSVIFTFPIRLWYDSEDIQAYPMRSQLPMVPVAEPPPSLTLPAEGAQAKAERGRQTLRDVIAARIEPHLLAEDAREFLISKSGGVLRDLMYMLRSAAVEALVDAGTRIEMAQATAVSLRLRNEYVNRLSPSSRSSAITIKEINDALGIAADWPRRSADHTPAFKLLLQNLCILEYNGETWYNLHPLVRDYLLIKEAEEASRRAKSPAV